MKILKLKTAEFSKCLSHAAETMKNGSEGFVVQVQHIALHNIKVCRSLLYGFKH